MNRVKCSDKGNYRISNASVGDCAVEPAAASEHGLMRLLVEVRFAHLPAALVISD